MVYFSFCVGLLSQGKYDVKQCCFMCVSSLEIRNCLAVLKEQGPWGAASFCCHCMHQSLHEPLLIFCFKDVNRS